MVLDTQSLHAAAGVPADTTGRDANKKVPGRKRGLAVDLLGLVIAVVPAASVHDNAVGIALPDRVVAATEPGAVKKALVDQAFKTTVKDHGAQVGIEVEVVKRNLGDAGFVPQTKRWVVEQTNGVLMLRRRLVRDYEHRPASAESRVYWAISDRTDIEDAHRDLRPHLSWRMTGGELTLRAVLVLLEEREIAEQAEAAREEIAELTALLDGFDKAAEGIRITRKTLLELPDPQLPVPPTAKLPDHPAYQQIMAVFAAADAPLRARAVCEAMDMEIAPTNVNNARLKLKRLVERGILAETEQGVFNRPRPWPPREPATRPLAPTEMAWTSTHLPPSSSGSRKRVSPWACRSGRVPGRNAAPRGPARRPLRGTP
ncbi:transposase [Streptomyces sp. NPDC094438]|uniref:transposase n=1 Tax=Streptomyces sp. NPDC094438 TaxID=3366061 RepID=UPI0037F5D077